jgi:hypothetical protein
MNRAGSSLGPEPAIHLARSVGGRTRPGYFESKAAFTSGIRR